MKKKKWGKKNKMEVMVLAKKGKRGEEGRYHHQKILFSGIPKIGKGSVRSGKEGGRKSIKTARAFSLNRRRKEFRSPKEEKIWVLLEIQRKMKNNRRHRRKRKERKPVQIPAQRKKKKSRKIIVSAERGKSQGDTTPIRVKGREKKAPVL